MRDKQELYAAILGIQLPWQVTEVDFSKEVEIVRVRIRMKRGTRLRCPTCNKVCPGYDTRRRSWRHLDTCQYKTILDADVPRVRCSAHESKTTSGSRGERYVDVARGRPRRDAVCEDLRVLARGDTRGGARRHSPKG
jgi:transposase